MRRNDFHSYAKRSNAARRPLLSTPDGALVLDKELWVVDGAVVVGLPPSGIRA